MSSKLCIYVIHSVTQQSIISSPIHSIIFIAAMSKERATWNSRYEKGPLNIMRDYVNIVQGSEWMDRRELEKYLR